MKKNIDKSDRLSIADIFGSTTADFVLDEKELIGGYSQWTSEDGIRFFPACRTVESLTPGTYEIQQSDRGLFFSKIETKNDNLLIFPETNAHKVIQEITNFWDKEDIYHKYGLMHRRGIILYGPPGSGKSSTIRIVVDDVIRRKGIVLKFSHPYLFIEGVRIIRKIQPNCPIVALMEDIDGILEVHNESEVLNILDGVEKVEKIVFLATTNYPEELGPRIMNRPSRFDRRYKMPHPSAESRKLYFEYLLNQVNDEDRDAIAAKLDIKKWVKDTDEMSVAHLKELFIAVCILGDSYQDALKLLQKMTEEKPTSSEDNSSLIGFSKT